MLKRTVSLWQFFWVPTTYVLVIGIDHVWQNKGTFSKRSLINAVEKKSIETYNSFFKEAITGRITVKGRIDKLRTFKMFKNNYKMENYLSLKVDKHIRHFSKIFLFFYMLNCKNRAFNPYFWIGTCPMRKTLLQIIRELNLLSFWWKHYRLLWNFLSASFMSNPSLRLFEVLLTSY